MTNKTGLDKSIQEMIEQNTRESRCKWCHPDENGQYRAGKFLAPNGESAIMLFFAGNAATINLEYEKQQATMKMEIFFCPMCGRKFETGGSVQ